MFNIIRRCKLAPRLVTRPNTKRHMERLEVQNCLRTKWPVFVAFFVEKLPQNYQCVRNFCLRGWLTADLSLL